MCMLFGLSIGKNVCLCSGIRFLSIGNCSIGDNTIINRNCILDNRINLTIGSNVSIATNCNIFTLGHDLESDNFSVKGLPVVIDDYVCVFANSLIMPGVIVGKGAVIYSGSVVTRSIDEMCIVGGNPAIFLKRRSKIPSYRLDSTFWFN